MTSKGWQEVAPGEGLFEREFDDFDAVYTHIIQSGLPLGRSHWTISSSIKLEQTPEDFIAGLRKAWITVRYEQPSIATLFDHERRVRTYRVGKDHELEHWLEETFQVIEGLSSTELLPKLRAIERPTLYVLPKTQELLFRSPHIHIDGVGTVGFWNDLLSAFANPRPITFGDEIKNFAPSFWDATNTPTHKEQHTDRANKLLADLVSSSPSIGLPFKAAALPGDTSICITEFSSRQTERVIKAAKDRGLTPTHAAAAALILATQELSPNRGQYVGLIAFDYRSWTTPETRRFNVSLLHSGWPLIIEPTNFSELTSKLRKFYKETAQDQELLSVLGPWGPRVLQALTASQKSLPLSGGSRLNSLGLIDKKIKTDYGKVKVGGFWLAVDSLTPDAITYFYTFQDQITLCTCFNEAFFDKELIKEFQALLSTVLLKGLDLKDLI